MRLSTRITTAVGLHQEELQQPRNLHYWKW